MNKLLIITGFFLIVSCSKNAESDFLDVHVDLSLVDSSGSDLINPDFVGSYNNDNIKLFHLNNGVAQQFFCSNCDNQKGYDFFERDEKYVMRIFTNFEVQQDGSDPITYIQWNETDTDTLQCHIIRNEDGSFISCNKVLYNDSIVFDNNGERYFTIIKD